MTEFAGRRWCTWVFDRPHWPVERDGVFWDMPVTVVRTTSELIDGMPWVPNASCTASRRFRDLKGLSGRSFAWSPGKGCPSRP